MDLFNKYQKPLAAFISEFLSTQKVHYKKTSLHWTTDVFEKLIAFVPKGKMIRGSLVLLGYELFSKNPSDETIKIAAAIEIMHAGLLIHDDIMDQDRLRRNQKSIYAQFEEHPDIQHSADKKRLSESLATCVGDICFFLSFQLLNSLKMGNENKQKIISIYNEEIIAVGLAQMDDIYFRLAHEEPKSTQIENIYRFKTGRYSFSLPLTLGALEAGANNSSIQQLEALGEKMGIMFQIRDDYLGVFGDSSETGKPVGNDISENKKTLLRSALFKALTPGEKNKIAALFGKKDLTPNEVLSIGKICQDKGIIADIDAQMEKLALECQSLIKGLPISDLHKSAFDVLLTFNKNRNK